MKGAAGKPGLKGEPGDAIDSSALDAILKGGKGNNKLTGSKVGHLFILKYIYHVSMTSVCWKVQTMSPRKVLERCTSRLLIVLKGTSVAKNMYLANTTKN